MPVSFEQRYPGAGEEEGEDDVGEGGAEADDFRRKNRFKQVKFCLAHLLPCQALLLCLLLRFSRYELRADASLEENGAPAALGGGVGRTETEHLLRNFTFQVVLVLQFVGFCILLPSRHPPRYSGAARVLSVLLASLALQLALVCRGLSFLLLRAAAEAVEDEEATDEDDGEGDVFRLGVHDLTEALLACVSLSLAAAPGIAGRVAPANMMVVVVLHIFSYTVCRLTIEEVFLSADSGVILPVHLFGPIFGACCGLVLSLGGRSASPAPSSPSPFPLVGASLLLVSLPVTNGIASESDAEMTRAVVNTLLATAAAASTSIAVAIAYSHIREKPVPSSSVLHGSMVSGGIAVGCTATLMLQPYGATAVGVVAGAASAGCFLALEAVGKERWMEDENLTFSFHAMPALISAVVGIIMAGISEDREGMVLYYESLYHLYPARIPTSDRCTVSQSPCKLEIISTNPFLEGKARGRSAAEQAGYQTAAVVFAIALGGSFGAIAGFIMRLSAKKCGNRFPPVAFYEGRYLLNERRTGEPRAVWRTRARERRYCYEESSF